MNEKDELPSMDDINMRVQKNLMKKVNIKQDF